MRLCWLVVGLLLVGTGCGAARVVRLDTGQGAPLEYAPPTWDEQVEVDEEAFSATLARLLLEVPLSLRPSQAGRLLLATSTGHTLDDGFRLGLRREYGRWCAARESSGDCLSLLEDGLGFDEMDRLQVALAFAVDPIWEGVTEELSDTLQPELLYGVVIAGLASYVALLAFPEPVVSKTGALLLTAWMVAYLGTGPFLTMARASLSLKQSTDRATTFAELEVAGARFGKVLGRNGMRVVILLVTAALGGGLATRGPTLPGFPLAARLLEAQGGIRLLGASGVRSIAVVESGLVVGLAPGAVATVATGPAEDSSVSVKEPHVDVPKHNLERLAPTWAEQRRILVDAIRQLDGTVSPVATNSKGAISEGALQVKDRSGATVSLTLRWFKYSDGRITLNTAFISPGSRSP